VEQGRVEKPASTDYFVRIGKLKAAGISPEVATE
jgi:hypothetical protein